MITITMSDDQARAVCHALRQQAAHEVSNAYRSLLSDTGPMPRITTALTVVRTQCGPFLRLHCSEIL